MNTHARMQADRNLNRTPLYDRHVALGARMVPFAGFEMPLQYTGIVNEHLAVRSAAGLFDVSHMGEVLVHGRQALAFVQYLVTNDAATLTDGRAMYTVMCRDDGGILDDLLVYRLASRRYMLVLNADNIASDLAWIEQQSRDFDVSVEDVSAATALVALQGPQTGAILSAAGVDGFLENTAYYHFLTNQRLAGAPDVLISRTGYTGEIGVEIYVPGEYASQVWDALLDSGADHGLLPAGLGARDTLRLEAGFALYGNDIDVTTDPFAAGLAWLVKLEKGDFMGRDALKKIRQNGSPRRLVGFVMDERGIPRRGYPLVASGKTIGEVTSGGQSPVRKCGIGLGYVENQPELIEPPAPIWVLIRDRPLAAHVERPPLHKS